MVLESTCKKSHTPAVGLGVSSQHCHWENPNKPVQAVAGLNHALITPQRDNTLSRAGLAPRGSGASAQDPVAAPAQAPLPTAPSFPGTIGTTSFILSIQVRLGKQQLVWCPCDSAAYWCHAGTLWDQLPSASNTIPSPSLSPFLSAPFLLPQICMAQSQRQVGKGWS